MINRLGIYAMTEKGRRVLAELSTAHRECLSWVVAARDNSLTDDGFEAIHDWCRQAGIPFYERGEIPQEPATHALAIAWRWLIPDSSTRLIVIHDSLLPKYRGFNPLVTALIAGDDEIGATALWANADYDCGDIIAQRSCSVSYPLRIADAIDQVSALYVDLARFITAELQAGRDLPATPQDDAQASYSLWRDTLDYALDWSASAAVLKRQVDAQSAPYTGATTQMDGETVRILAAEVLPDVEIANRTPGKVIFLHDGLPTVVCGHGLLRIEDARREQDGAALLPFKKFRVRFG